MSEMKIIIAIKSIFIAVLICLAVNVSAQDYSYRDEQPFVGLPSSVQQAVIRFKMDRTAFNAYYNSYVQANNTTQKWSQTFDDPVLTCSNSTVFNPANVNNNCNIALMSSVPNASERIIFTRAGYKPYSAMSSNHNTVIDENAPILGYDVEVNHGDRTTVSHKVWQNGHNPIYDQFLYQNGDYTMQLGSGSPHERDGVVIKIAVTQANEILNLDYLTDLSAGNYAQQEFKPYFKFRIRNSNGQIINDPQAFIDTDTHDWKYLSLNLHNYIGQQIYIQFEAGDSPHSSNYAGQSTVYLTLGCPLEWYTNNTCVGDINYWRLFSDITIADNGFTPVPATVTPTTNFSSTDVSEGFSYTFYDAGFYKFKKRFTKPGNRDLEVVFNINVVDNTTSCDRSITTPTTGCVSEGIALLYQASSYYDNNYRFEWTFGNDAKRYTLNGVEYVGFCSTGVKNYHLKVYKGNTLVRDLDRNLTISDCKNFYSNISLLGDTVCVGSPIPYSHPFLPNAKSDTYNVQWSFSGSDYSFSQDGVNNYVNYSFVGKRKVTLNIIHKLLGCTSSSSKSFFVKDCNGELTCCPTKFSPPSGNYIFNGWTSFDPQTQTGLQPFYKILVTYQNGTKNSFPFYPNISQNVEGWYQCTGKFGVGELALDVQVSMENPTNDPAYFDDIRIQPFNSSMKGYVFDNVTKRMSAELDENNYATFYEYDEEGNLIRIKKETERGIMTIQESNQNILKP